MRKTGLRLIIGLLVVGVAAAIVYGASALIARATPHIPVSSSLALTTTISGYLAAICLGPLAVLGLGLLFGDTARLLIPARHERFNLELASTAFPAHEAYETRKSFAETVDRLIRCDALRQALEQTRM